MCKKSILVLYLPMPAVTLGHIIPCGNRGGKPEQQAEFLVHQSIYKLELLQLNKFAVDLCVSVSLRKIAGGDIPQHCIDL